MHREAGARDLGDTDRQDAVSLHSAPDHHFPPARHLLTTVPGGTEATGAAAAPVPQGALAWAEHTAMAEGQKVEV